MKYKILNKLILYKIFYILMLRKKNKNQKMKNFF